MKKLMHVLCGLLLMVMPLAAQELDNGVPQYMLEIINGVPQLTGVSGGGGGGGPSTDTIGDVLARGVNANNLPITNLSALIPNGSGTVDLGSPTHWWGSLYASGHTIYLDGVPMLTVTNGELVIAYPVANSNGTSYVTSVDLSSYANKTNSNVFSPGTTQAMDYASISNLVINTLIQAFGYSITNVFTNTVLLADGSEALTGSLLPASPYLVDLGSPALPWRDIYLGTSSVWMAGMKMLSVSNDYLVTGMGIAYDSADWTGGNMIWVPLTKAGYSQTELLNNAISNAVAGDTLRLASGTYVITNNIVVNKALNIRGEGSATTFTCSVAPTKVFYITASNVRLADISIVHSAATLGIDTANNLTGIIIKNVTVVGTGNSNKTGVRIWGSSANLLNLLVNETSLNGSAYGVYVYNTAATTNDAIVNILDTVVAASGLTDGEAFQFNNINDANTITVNLWKCDGHSLPTVGVSDCGLELTSTTTASVTVNAHTCTFSGADYDVKVENPNVANLVGCVLENGVAASIAGGVINNNGYMAVVGMTASNLVIGAGGSIMPASSNTINIGSQTMPFRSVNASNFNVVGSSISFNGTVMMTESNGQLQVAAPIVVTQGTNPPVSYAYSNDLAAVSVRVGNVEANTSNWNTAYGWGNHATAGYAGTGTVAALSTRVGNVEANTNKWNAGVTNNQTGVNLGISGELYVTATNTGTSPFGSGRGGLVLGGATDVDKNMLFMDGTKATFSWNTYRNEGGKYFYLSDYEAGKDLMAISRSGRFGINKMNNLLNYHTLTSQADVSSDLELDLSKTEYTPNYQLVYLITVDGTNAVADTYTIQTSRDSGVTFTTVSTGNVMYTSSTNIGNGVWMYWTAKTGHTVGETRKFLGIPQLPRATFSVSPMFIDEVMINTNLFGTPYWVDRTYEANSSQYGEFRPFRAGTNSATYIGMTIPNNSFYINITTAGVGVAYTLEYWNGSTWAAASILDGTANFTQSGDISIDNSSVTAWTNGNLTVDTYTNLYYWCRIRSTNVVTTTPYVQSITRHGANRLQVYDAPLDDTPTMKVDSAGNTWIGGLPMSTATVQTFYYKFLAQCPNVATALTASVSVPFSTEISDAYNVYTNSTWYPNSTSMVRMNWSIRSSTVQSAGRGFYVVLFENGAAVRDLDTCVSGDNSDIPQSLGTYIFRPSNATNSYQIGLRRFSANDVITAGGNTNWWFGEKIQ